jgi:hypothetical protein
MNFPDEIVLSLCEKLKLKDLRNLERSMKEISNDNILWFCKMKKEIPRSKALFENMKEQYYIIRILLRKNIDENKILMLEYVIYKCCIYDDYTTLIYFIRRTNNMEQQIIIDIVVLCEAYNIIKRLIRIKRYGSILIESICRYELINIIKQIYQNSNQHDKELIELYYHNNLEFLNT